MLDKTILKVKITGDYACFTRPDLKVERMSYPCMTFSAARGILDSILWKPEFKWYLRRILVLNPVKFISVRRNEVTVKSAGEPLYLNKEVIKVEKDGSEKVKYPNRTPRNSIILKDVAYVIEASIWQDKLDSKNPPPKYVEMFRHRVAKGKCYRRPYLGTREFSCAFLEADGNEKTIKEILPIGSMFYDMYYNEAGLTEPLYTYDTAIRDGVLEANETLNAKLMTASHIRPALNEGIKELLAFYTEEEEHA